MEKTHRYIIFGPQGSGKGTQAELLAEELGIPHIATGDLFRDEVARDTELGRRIKDDIEKGKLMPDEDANALVQEEFKKLKKSEYVLDGYPRTVSQARFLDSLQAPTNVVLLELHDDESVQRISGRRICSRCHHVYHLMYHRSKDPKVCDECGGELVIRGDDQEAPIRERLRTYHAITEPIAEYYEAQGKLKRVPADKSVFEVKVEIRRALNVPV